LENKMKKLIEVLTDEKRQEEIAPGVLIERRRLLWLPALAAAAFAAEIMGNDTQAQSAKSAPGWDEFLKQCLPKAQELHKDASRAGQEAYLRWLGLMATSLRAADPPPAKLGKFKNLEPASFFGVGYRGEPFFVVEWRMAQPSECQRLHGWTRRRSEAAQL
jgi:hypothetical protein